MSIHIAREKYCDKRFSFEGIRVKPGEYAVASGESLLMTVLGSCVAVCLSDKNAQVIGMNHFLLPIQPHLCPGPVGQNARYGAHAMELLINACLGLGAQRKNLQASVFGGARVLSVTSAIGASNVDFALRYLAMERIPVKRTDVGGRLARKVLFTGPSAQIEVSSLNALQRVVGVVGADAKAIVAARDDIDTAQRRAPTELFAL